MNQIPAPFSPLLRLLALAVALSAGVAQADDYSEVTQLMRAGKSADAMARVEQYLGTKPRDPQMRFLKGVLLKDSGKPAEAIATFTKLTEDYPELPEPYNNLAVLYAGQNQYDKARAALEMAIRTNPSYATAHENLGDVYAKLASQAYNKALQLDSSNAAVAPKLALIRELFTPNAKTARPGVPSAAVVAPVQAPPAKPASTAAASAVVSPATPAAPTAATPVNAGAAQQAAEAAVLAWAKAWAGKDVAGYLAAYDRSFSPPAGQSRKVWEEERRKRITGKSRISVKLENLSVQITGDKALVKFRQDYRADALAVSSRKTLEMIKAGEQWLIVRESTGA